MKYRVKFFIGSKPLVTTVEAESEAEAKQKVYAKIRFESVQPIDPTVDKLSDIFGFFK